MSQHQQFSFIMQQFQQLPHDKLDSLLAEMRQSYNKMNDQQLSFLLFKLTQHIMKLKSLPLQMINFLQQCIKDTIKISLNKNLLIGTQALRNIFNTQSQYYRHNKLDTQLKHPIGINRQVYTYQPEIGQQCDIVKPYLSSSMYCGWTRGTIISKEGKRYMVKYANTQMPSQTKQQPLCAKLATRTQDYQWRTNLTIGSQVDAYHRVWYKGTVINQILQNGVRKVRITFKIYSESGNKIDKYGQKYYGLPDDQDQVYDVLSYRIQKPGKMSRKFCQYSATAQQYIIDDTYDLIFQKDYQQKPFVGIMRPNFCKSQSILTFYQTFCQQGGIQKTLELLNNYNKDQIDIVLNALIIIANTTFLIPTMRIYDFLPKMIEKTVNLLYDNNKILNPQINQMAYFFIDIAAKRTLSLSQKHSLINEIRKKLALFFLKMNMQKQLLALRLLYEIICPVPKKYSIQEKIEIDEYLLDNRIFYTIIQPNIHQQILLRSIQLIKYLLLNNLIGFKQIEYLWNIFPQTDVRGRSTVQKMIGQISKTFSIQYINNFIDRILQFKESQLTYDNLSLLKQLKDHKQLTDEYRFKVLEYLWQLMTVKSMNVTKNIQQQIQKVFKTILPRLQNLNYKLQFLNIIISRIKQIKQLNNQFQILKQFILTYPKRSNSLQKIQQQQGNNPDKVPSNISEVIQLLKSKNIYLIIIDIFNQLKSNQKMKNLLWFTSFMFENDHSNVDNIAKVFYQKMGPTQIFLQWAQHITNKAHHFFLQIFQKTQQITKFQSLTTSALDAIKAIIFDINITEGNLKIVKKTRGIAIQSQPPKNVSSTQLPVQGPLQGPLQGPVQGPTQKPETTIFLYLIKSPYQCKGIKFLQQLLCVVKNNKVYDQIIKLIIQFFVDLDESIQKYTHEFRQQFLMNIISRIQQIIKGNQFNDKIKLKLEISINLLQTLFSQTQKEGLMDIKPHFQCIQGEKLRLKIENQLTNNKMQDFKIEVNQNITFYSLKKKIALHYNQNPNQINIHRFVHAIADQNNGKTLLDLHLYNDQTIKIIRKTPKDIPRKDLLNQSGQKLSHRFNQIVQNWFNSYKNQKDQMGIQQLKKLSAECWRGSLLRQINKLNQMLKKYDKNSKGYLDIEEFKTFFITKSTENSTAIWKIINIAGYKNNLKNKDQPQQEISKEIFPRRILSTKKVYQVIFNLLKNKVFEAVHLNFYRLLSQLQTDTSIKEEVLINVKSLIEDQTCLYKLSYILQTVLSEIHTNNAFFLDFYKFKGCDFIYHKLCQLMNEMKSIYTFDTFIKTIIMPNIIKILNSYIFCLKSQNRILKLIKNTKINHSQIDLISKQVMQIKKNQNFQIKRQEIQNIQKLKNYTNNIHLQQYLILSEKILFNLIQNFNNDLLQKLTNEIVRMYCALSLALNTINIQKFINALKSDSLNFRRTSQNLIYLFLLHNNNPDTLKSTLDMLLKNLPTESKHIYSYFFSLLEKVLEMYLDLKKDQKQDAEFIQLAEYLFNKLLNELPNQNRNAILADKLLFGVLVVINILLIKRQGVCKAFKHKKKLLLQKCLFFYHPNQRISNIQITPEMLKTEKQPNHFNDYVKCKSEETRKVLMEIIYHLHEVSAEQDPDFIDQYILPIFNDLPKNKKKFDTKNLQVGLNNLGSTCYLNSMLQILNFIGPFRNGIMQSQSEFPLIKELKRLFSYLYFSERQDYVPEQLLNSFMPPILKGIQQDTTQFLNILFDQVQSGLKDQAEQHILQQIFQGTQAAQMICHLCGQKRERKQTFFTYGVQIQGKYDLNLALQGMNSGQLISDCLCEYCGHRSDTTKRTVIDNIPNIFFIHLRRIVFNYDVFMNTKIHTRLQFPLQLNFQPYTKQGLELREKLGVQYLKSLNENQSQKHKFQQMALHQKDKSYYRLKLKGIIVHSGGPDVGHYWSTVKRQNSWIKFDDSKVSVFPHSAIENQCFGGNFQSDEWGGMGTSSNAYVLIYQKQVKSNLVLGSDDNKYVVPYDKFQVYNTSDLYKQVWLDNHSLMLENHLFKQSFCRQFLNFLVHMLKITPSNSKIKLISQVLYKVCFHSGQTGKLMELFIENLSQIQPNIFQNYIIADRQRTFDLLFHFNINLRQFTAIYMEKVLLQTYKKGTLQNKQSVIKFINQYLILLHHDAAKNWLRIDGYFKLFEGLVVGSVEIYELYQFFLSKNLISYFIDFIIQKASPIKLYPKKYSIGTKSNPANFANAIKIILFLYQRSYGMTGFNFQLPPIDPKYLYHLSDNDVLCLCSIQFYEKMLKQRQNLQFLGALIQRMSIKNIKFSQTISRVMLCTLNQITDAKDQMIDICNCITKFLIITDQYWQNRAQFMLGYSSPYIFNDNLLSSLDEQRFVYYSTLQDLFPIECLFAYCHINRLRNPLAVLHILRAILEVCVVSQQAKEYLLSQKSASYHHKRYLDWIKPYVNNIINTLSLKKDKTQALKKQIQSCNIFIGVLQSIQKPINNIITGKTLNSKIVDRFSDKQNAIQIIISNVQCYTLDSQPTGQGNSSLDKYLVNGRLNKKLTSSSNIHCLFKQFNKPLAIKQAQQQAEDKQIQSLFDDVVDNKKDKSTTIIQQKKQSQPISQKIIPQSNIKSNRIEIQQQHENIEEINIPELKLCTDYFRKIQIINNSTKTKLVTLKFNKTQNSNIVAPSKIHFISSKKAVQTMWVCKDDPSKGWGIIDYKLIVNQKDTKIDTKPKWFKIYGGQNIGHVSEPMQIQIPIQQQKIEKVNDQILTNQQQPQITQINCPICTFLNFSTLSNCQVCGSDLF